MSEQQSLPADTKQEGPDDREPSLERQAELEAGYEKNLAAGHSPYNTVGSIRTRGELMWILRRRGWQTGSDDDGQAPAANFSGAWMNNANLAEVWLAGANLYGALAFGARFPRAALDGANLTRAVLARADLRDAHLVGATCVETKFVEANLRGAVLRDADLSNANLWRACLDQRTVLDGVTLGPHPHLDDIKWGGAQLIGIAWDDVTVLPAELRTQTESYTNEYTDEVLPKDALRRAQEFGYAARMYQQLADALRGQGLTEHAGRFEERASEMRNLADYWQSRA